MAESISYGAILPPADKAIRMMVITNTAISYGIQYHRFRAYRAAGAACSELLPYSIY